jgi:hypothetical protein
MTAEQRRAHCQRIGSLGGRTTVERHGTWHMAAIGKAGKEVTIGRHGVSYWKGITRAKGWRAPAAHQLSFDLTAGAILAELKGAAAVTRSDREFWN